MKFLSLTLLFFSVNISAFAQDFSSSAGTLSVSTIARGLEHPWGLEILPDGRMLVTERPGRLRIVAQNGTLSAPIAGVPKVYVEGQGGLLDVVLDPDFQTNHTIYLSYAEEENGKAGTAVTKAILKNYALENVEVIFRQQPKVKGKNHWGSRLVFARNHTLFITLGERFDYSEKAQDLSTHLGKVVRINTDGSAPKDNPFMGKENALPEIWSYGHRNVQAAALHPDTGELWTGEHGPRGGDEINRTLKGKNYGWPEASYGSHYTLIPIPDNHAKQGFMEPAFHWNPSISPSGMLFYTGKQFPEWKGDIFVGALNGMCLIRLDVEGGKILKEERMLQDLNERIRDVTAAADGTIYIITDNADGRILKIQKK